jgi:tRNA-specific adenosine deaminase 3
LSNKNGCTDYTFLAKPQQEIYIPREEWPFDEVLADEYERQLETIDVYTAHVEPKQTNSILKYVADI